MKDIDVYSLLSQLCNELEDDLTLDIEKGENGYDSYEHSYKAVRKFTLKKLKTLTTRLKRKIEKEQKKE